jgi:hypothetical protein
VGLAHVGAKDHHSALVAQVLDGRQSLNDTLIAGDHAVLQGHVEVATDKNLLTGNGNVFNGLLVVSHGCIHLSFAVPPPREAGMEVQNYSLYTIPHFPAIIKGFLNFFRKFLDICEGLGYNGCGERSFLWKMTRGIGKLQFIGELPRPPRHKTGEGRSPSLRVEAGSAEGGPERLGAHR